MVPERTAAALERFRDSLLLRCLEPLVAGRDVLEVGCGDGSGLVLLTELGARTVAGTNPEGVDRDEADIVQAEAVELPFEPDSFDLLVHLGDAGPPAILTVALEEFRRILRPDGVLAILTDSAGAGAVAAAFSHSRAYPWSVGIAASLGDTARQALEPAAGAEVGAEKQLVLGLEERDAELPPVAKWAAGDLLASLLNELSDWEQRARGAEAEVAAMRWENRIAGEKLTALVNHLVRLENRPARRLRRLARGKRPAVSHQRISDPRRDGG
jgi:SAM-dependent methyltransferase